MNPRYESEPAIMLGLAIVISSLLLSAVVGIVLAIHLIGGSH